MIFFSGQLDQECSNEHSYSGLYSYHIPTSSWTKLRDDCPQIMSRIGHSALFHPVSNYRNKQFIVYLT